MNRSINPLFSTPYLCDLYGIPREHGDNSAERNECDRLDRLVAATGWPLEAVMRVELLEDRLERETARADRYEDRKIEIIWGPEMVERIRAIRRGEVDA